MDGRIEIAVDGRRLCVVTFSRGGPGSELPDVDVIYEVYHCDEDFMSSTPILVGPLSSTRTDTREAIELTREERRKVQTEAARVARGDLVEW